MALDDHLLGSLDVRVAVPDATMAQALRPRLEALAWEMMPRVIEQVFDAVAPEEMLELTRLDLDLGTVRADELEEDALAALRTALTEALAAALHRARHGIDDQARLTAAGVARLARFESFLASGTLTFPNRPGTFDVADELRRLASDSPVQLVALLRRNARHRHALERLALQAGEDGLGSLLGLLAPADAAVILALLVDIVLAHRWAPAPLLKRLSEPALKHLLWVTTLEFLLRDAGSQFNRRRFLATLIDREAKRLGIAFDALLELLAEAVVGADARAPLRSSLPGTLRELLDERRRKRLREHAIDEVMGKGGSRRSERLDDAIIADGWRGAIEASQGDLQTAEQALERVRLLEMGGDRRAFHRLMHRLGEDGFAALVATMAGDLAPRLASELDLLVALHGQRQFFPIGRSALKRQVSGFILAYLIRHRSAHLDLKALWRAIFDGLAAVARIDAVELAARMADRLRSADGGSNTALLAAIAPGSEEERQPTGNENASDRDAVADRAHRLLALLRVSASGAEFIAAAGPLSEREFEAVLVLFAPVEAVSLLTDVAWLAALHRASPLLDMRQGALLAMARAALLDMLLHTPGPVATRRRAAWRAIIKRLAVAAGRSSRDFAAMLRGRLRESGAPASLDVRAVPSIVSTSQQPELADRRAGIEHFLLTGMPAARGADLLEALANDPAWLADRLDALAREMPPEELADRLLDWLMPSEIAALLAPAQAGALISSVARTAVAERDAWRALLIVLLRGDMPPPTYGRSLGTFERADRLAALADWLDHGIGAMPASHMRAIPSDLLALDMAELTSLLLGEDEEATLIRLNRTTAAMTAPDAERLLMRIAPWTARMDGPFTTLLQGDADKGRRSILLRAAAAALVGAEVDFAALSVPLAIEPEPSLKPMAGDRSGKMPEVAHLLAWLDGGSASAADTTELVRLFVQRADAGDPALAAFLASRRSSARARARWAAILPVPALTRLVHLLVPTEARALVDGVMLLATAWRQVAPFGARRPAPQDIWQALLDRIVEPARVAVPKVIDALVVKLAGDDAQGSARLRERAGKLARDGGYATVATALRRAPAPARPRPVARPRQTETKPADAPEEPKHALYVGNAGLVLLNPFLPTLFERLCLLSSDAEGRPFVPQDETASRAIHLLQYLVDGRLDRTEPELVLNKLLCGVPSFVPVAGAIEPVQADLDICDDLLRGVIANWPMLADMTPDTLRETFLQREGRLRHGDGKWVLQVQRKTLDVLTDQLPWSFALVYHRWMIDPIHVTW